MGHIVRPNPGADARRAAMTLIQGEGRGSRRPPLAAAEALPVLERDDPRARAAVRVLWGGEQAEALARALGDALAGSPELAAGLHALGPEAARLLGEPV